MMCAVVPALALIEFVDQRMHGRLDALAGIRPQQISGLDGILFAPLVHLAGSTCSPTAHR